MPAIILGTDQLPYGFGNRLPSSCVQLCHVRDSVASVRNSATPKWFQMEKILFFESQGVLGPCQREEMPLAGTAAMLFTRRHSGFVTGSSSASTPNTWHKAPSSPPCPTSAISPRCRRRMSIAGQCSTSSTRSKGTVQATDGRRRLDDLGLAAEKGWPADVAELVDARDLKSLGANPCGFDPRRPHQQHWHDPADAARFRRIKLGSGSASGAGSK